MVQSDRLHSPRAHVSGPSCFAHSSCPMWQHVWKVALSTGARSATPAAAGSWVALPCALETPSLHAPMWGATPSRAVLFLGSVWVCYAQDTSFPALGCFHVIHLMEFGQKWAVLHHDSSSSGHERERCWRSCPGVFVFHFCIKVGFLISLQCVFCVSRLTGVYTGASVHPHTLSFNYLIQILLFFNFVPHYPASVT